MTYVVVCEDTLKYYRTTLGQNNIYLNQYIFDPRSVAYPIIKVNSLKDIDQTIIIKTITSFLLNLNILVTSVMSWCTYIHSTEPPHLTAIFQCARTNDITLLLGK